MKTYRLSHPTRGWARLSWHPEDRNAALTPQRTRALEVLAEIPGVRWQHCVVDVPHTVWRLHAWYAVLHAFGVYGDWMPPTRPNEPHATYKASDQVEWEGDLKPYPWQVEGAQKALDSLALLLCDDMGLGKTRTAIEAALWFREYAFMGHRPILVIAPGFLRTTWKQELLATRAVVTEVEFCALETRDITHKSYRPGCDVYFVHYDIAKAWCSKIASSIRPAVAIVDEIHYAKNGRTQRAEGTKVAAGLATMRIGLTGTPMDNRPSELWSPLSIVCGKNTWGSPVEFRKRYCGAMPNAFRGYTDQGPTNVDELRERLQPYYLRRTIDDLDFELPPLRRQRIDVPMSAMRDRKHRKLLDGYSIDEIVRAIVDGRAGEDVFKRLHQLREVTSQAKIETTVEHVSSLLQQGQSVVCFSWRRKTAEALAAKFAKGESASSDSLVAGCVVHGGFSQDQRDELVWQFQKHGGFISATYGALKEGVTLTKARAVVLHDLDWTMSTILQAEKRIHRLGQTGACLSFWMTAEKSIDTVLARLLALKADWIETTLGIDAPMSAVDEVELADIASTFDVADWVRKQLEAFRG